MSRNALKYRVVSGVGGRLIDAAMRTVRFTTGGSDAYRTEWANKRPVIFTLWHGRLLPLAWFHRKWNLVTLISESADGEYIARTVESWGYSVIRGSSSRGGGPAFRKLVRALRDGRSVAVTPDGPRGPRERVKPGILLAAQLTGFGLVPVAAAASRGWWFEGWDRFLVPKPFCHVAIRYGDPIFVPRDADETGIARISETVEHVMAELTAAAEAAARE